MTEDRALEIALALLHEKRQDLAALRIPPTKWQRDVTQAITELEAIRDRLTSKR